MKKTILAAVFLALGACSPTDAPLVAPPADYGLVESTAKGTSMKFDPQVDILFIIDNSASMKSHQDNLIRNIKEFVRGIADTSVIDFHIGVTTIWDSHRYGNLSDQVHQTCGGVTNWEPIGSLKALTAPSGKEALLKTQDARFVSGRNGLIDVLSSTLNVGIEPLVDYKGEGTCATGPEDEESFSPLLASLSEDRQNGANKGFWRKDSLKVFMIVTDATDATQLTASYMDAQLRKLLGAPAVGPQNKYRVYAVDMVKGLKINRSCMPDPAFKAKDDKGHYIYLSSNGTKIAHDNSITQLAQLSGGKAYSICSSSYGKALAEVGDEIRQTTLTEIRHDLYSWPQKGTLRVCLGPCNDAKTTDLPRNQAWYYDSRPDYNQVVIQGDVVDWASHPDAQLEITYTPIQNVFSPKTKIEGF